MDWFSILKNQVASTKGKQFQLDFNQPMVEEEEDCKSKFLAVGEKLRNLKINGLTQMHMWKNHNGSKYHHYFKNTTESNSRGVEVSKIPMIEHQFKFSENVPNEIYCRAIKAYETASPEFNAIEVSKKYKVATEKGEVRKTNNEILTFYECSIFDMENAYEIVADIRITTRFPIIYRFDTGPKMYESLNNEIENAIKEVMVF